MFATIVTLNKLKRLISLGQNGKLAGSGSGNYPDMDDAQPVERADLTRLFGRVSEHGNPVSLPKYWQVKPQGTLIECGIGIAEEAKAIL